MDVTGSCRDCGRDVGYPERACSDCGGATAHWDAIAREVLATTGPRQDVPIPASAVGDPEEEGYVSRHANPTNGARDLRKRASAVVDEDPRSDGGAADLRGLHVKDHGGAYSIHWDVVDPAASPVRHVRHDLPGAAVAGGAVGGVLVAGALLAARAARR